MRQEPRGVIVPSMDFESKMIKSSPLLSAHSLRYFLLYWDKVVSVNNPIFGIGNSDSNSDFSVLKKINFIEERGSISLNICKGWGGICRLERIIESMFYQKPSHIPLKK